ncbi:MAG: phosphatase family protein [Thermoleophilia bacterium]|nr:phosphatase family protein [Thermoleophilia bacterium]
MSHVAAHSAVVPAVAPPVAATTSAPPIEVPADFMALLDGAVRDGTADANAFAREHTPAERWMVPDWALLRMGWPPQDDKEDLAYLHAVAKTRTPKGVEAAQYWAKHGLTDEWERMLDEYAKRVGPVQARAGRKLLHDALMMTNEVTQTAKAAANRKRPFVVDPTLELAVDKPGNNPSYPSGHASAAFAACMVLAHLMPDRADHFMELAKEASWARVYAGVHFKTDVVAGAKMAATVVSYLTRTSMAVPATGTDSTNPGVAGTRRRIPGATLAGPALMGAAVLTAA